MEMKPLSGRRRAYDRILRFLLYFCAALTCALLLFIIGYIFFKGLPHVTWQFLSTQPSFIKDTIGILPNILNTVYLVGVTLIITLPLGVGAAIYLTEYARNRRLVAAIEFATETLTGIPSIIFGLVGMLFFCQLLGLQASLLAGSLTLVIVTIPTIIRTTQESLKTVPQSFREAALGLGAGKWHMIRTVVLPSSVDGIVTGCILAIGRIVGESAALLFTAGMGMSLNNFFGSVGNFIHSSGASLTVALYVYARERAEFDVAFAIAAILMLLTLVINLSAKLVGRTLKKTVPQSFREAALGLGAGKWHMIRTVVLPSSVDGIVTGCILAIGRIVGESAALLFTAGMGMSLNNFFGSVGNFIHSSGASLTVALYVYARERAEFDVAFAIAAILMLLTLVINLSAKLVGRTLKKK